MESILLIFTGRAPECQRLLAYDYLLVIRGTWSPICSYAEAKELLMQAFDLPVDPFRLSCRPF